MRHLIHLHRRGLMPCCALTLLSLTLFTGPKTVSADTADAACAIYPVGSDAPEQVIACEFYQAQGHVVITRSDGVVYDLTPSGSTPGNFTDVRGNQVYRQSGLGEGGLVFRLPDESVYVYWDTEMLNSSQ